MRHNDVGRPSILDNSETLRNIKELILQGLNDSEIQNRLKIPNRTWEDWKLDNFRGFVDFYTTWKHEYMLKIAEINLSKHMLSDNDKISLDASKFVSETLGKKHYSKRTDTDITSGGKPIPLLSALDVHSNNSPEETQNS